MIDNIGNNKLKIVHGIVTGSAKLKGIKIVHAWVEDDEYAYDLDGRTMRTEKIDKFLYYLMGEIKIIDTRRYDIKEALVLMEKTEHAGPWDDKLIQHAINEENSIYVMPEEIKEKQHEINSI